MKFLKLGLIGLFSVVTLNESSASDGKADRSASFTLSTSSYAGGETSTVIVSFKDSTCSLKPANEKKKPTVKDCDRVRVLADGVSKLASVGSSAHMPHYEIEFKSGAANWKKSFPLAALKACDAKGACVETGSELDRSVNGLVEFVSELAE